MRQTKVYPTSALIKPHPLHPTTFSSSSPDNLYVSAFTFKLCWWLVCILQAFDFAFLVAMTKLYAWLLSIPDAQVFLLGNMAFNISYRTLGIMNWCFAVVAALQGAALLWIVCLSLQARELTFSRVPTRKVVPLDHSKSVQPRSGRTRSVSNDDLGSVFRLVAKNTEYVTKRWLDPVFSVSGEYFDDYFLLVEYLEMSSQIYQAYCMSIYVATRWINNVFVIMIFLNGISTPLIHRLVPKADKPRRRLVSIVVSTVLNFINSLVIPLIIFMPYVRDFIPSTMFFSYELSYDDIWYPKARLENQQLFITSYLDFFTTLAPQWSLLSCLWTCESMLCREASTFSDDMIMQKQFVSSQQKTASERHRASHTWKDIFLYNVLWVSGVITLVIHITSQSPDRIAGCKLEATPWFTTKSSCVVLNINCLDRGIVRKDSEIGDVLSRLNTQTVFALIFSHCASLDIPPAIQAFHELTGFEIYNSTLHQWLVNASINQRDHSRLDYVAILRTNLSGIPDGLLDPLQLPTKIWDLDLVYTNLTSLPATINELWWGVDVLNLESGLFQELPPAIFNLSQDELELNFARNPIRSVDSAVFLLNLWGLRFRNTTLESLPESTEGTLEELVSLDLRDTLLQEIPLFIRDWYVFNARHGINMHHSVRGSPYCDRVIEDADESHYQSQVCAPNDELIDGFFPMEIIDAQRHG